jgi:large subunit ribosomal protein L23
VVNQRKREVNEAHAQTQKRIKYVVEKLFNVVVTNVRTMIVKGSKTKFKQIPGKKSDWKKAFISLKKGYDIDLANLK